jgi:uncharacterized protein (TIGR02687 family)
MKSDQVHQALVQKFNTDGERLVFWHDAPGDFADFIAGGLPTDLDGVKVLDLAKTGGLPAKLKLEREDPDGKYLVYSTGEPLPPEQDWLLDIRQYSAEFHADVASVWLHELGLNTLQLRDHLKARAVFLGNQDRRKKLKRLISANDDEATLDLKMLAVLVASPVTTPFAILRALCHGHMADDCFERTEPPQAMGLIEKMSLADRFWGLMHREFGYAADSPSVAGLLRQLFVSELFHQTNEARIEPLAHFVLPSAGRRNAAVFLTQWRDSSGQSASYDATAAAVADELGIGGLLAGLDLNAVQEAFTFWEAERKVVSGLKAQVLDDGPVVDIDAVTALATARKAGHWLAGPGRDRPERRAVADAYDAIVAAAELFAHHAKHRHALSYEHAEALLCAYRDELFAFDQCYRRFCFKAEAANRQGWDLLKTLAEAVEQTYDHGFLQPLGLEWGRILDGGFVSDWVVKGFTPQQSFYENKIRPHLAKADRRRAFVIISDAFRYEAAHELTHALNSRYRMDAELCAMLGALPSYTALGMASLLPHKTLGYSDKGDVLVDGAPVAGTEARGKQLAAVQGMACQAKDLLAMRSDEAREFTHGKRVVYIYHNAIDARGDSAATEGETFDAVAACIDELVQLAQFCVNKLNAAKVWITADHGFLFQQTAPDSTDKSTLSHKPAHALKVKKRYVIGPNLGATPEAHHGSTGATVGAEGGMEFWVPRGTNRFHFTGGARFVHGGAMPQEVVVPLVTVTQLRGKQVEGSRVEKVSVHVLGSNHKVTTPKHRFELIQTEAVGERRKPITLRAAIYDGAQPVSSVETITCDSTSEKVQDRKRTILLELKTGTYDKTKLYRLLLRDAESDAETQSVPVVIDRSFDDDF